jgi:hypothetical protein
VKPLSPLSPQVKNTFLHVVGSEPMVQTRERSNSSPPAVNVSTAISSLCSDSQSVDDNLSEEPEMRPIASMNTGILAFDSLFAVVGSHALLSLAMDVVDGKRFAPVDTKTQTLGLDSGEGASPRSEDVKQSEASTQKIFDDPPAASADMHFALACMAVTRGLDEGCVLSTPDSCVLSTPDDWEMMEMMDKASSEMMDLAPSDSTRCPEDSCDMNLWSKSPMALTSTDLKLVHMLPTDMDDDGLAQMLPAEFQNPLTSYGEEGSSCPLTEPASDKSGPWDPSTVLTSDTTTLTPSSEECNRSRLSGAAKAFVPQVAMYPTCSLETPAPRHQEQFADVVSIAVKDLLASDLVANVTQCPYEDGTYTIIIDPHESVCFDDVIDFSKARVLEATKMAKYTIFLMGYCLPEWCFRTNAHGFEATLCRMENTACACWHLYKKGYCKHGATCKKLHPSTGVIMDIIVRSARLVRCDGQKWLADKFIQQTTDVVMAAMAALRKCDYVEHAEGFMDAEHRCWTIQLTLKQSHSHHQDLLTSFAQKAILRITEQTGGICVLGYATKPFIYTPDGFVTILGDVQHQDKACWQFYSQGYCTLSAQKCKLVHSQCTLPLSVVIDLASAVADDVQFGILYSGPESFQ